MGQESSLQGGAEQESSLGERGEGQENSLGEADRRAAWEERGCKAVRQEEKQSRRAAWVVEEHDRRTA